MTPASFVTDRDLGDEDDVSAPRCLTMTYATCWNGRSYDRTKVVYCGLRERHTGNHRAVIGPRGEWVWPQEIAQ